MIVTVTPEVENSLRALAAQKSVDPALLGGTLLEEAVRAKGLLATSNGLEPDDDDDPEALARAIKAMIKRTPEEKKAAQERVLRECQPVRELPPGKTIFDVIPRIRGNETDEEVLLALERLS